MLTNYEIRHGAKPARPIRSWMVGKLQDHSVYYAVVERGKPLFADHAYYLLSDLGAFNQRLRHVASGLPAAGVHAR